jgi:hypothetical protein
MSFNNLKVSDLRKAADAFGVELAKGAKKNDIILALEDEGISYQMYEHFSNTEKAEVEEPVGGRPKSSLDLRQEPGILVKMDRENFSYQVGGYVFTKEHPFVAMSQSDAQQIFDFHIGFRPATPREVQEFYS